jgi:hypothetical protein
VPHSEGRGFQPRVSSELSEQRLNVGPDGRRRDTEAADHRGGVLASYQQFQALPLACGEAPGKSYRITLGSELMTDRRPGGHFDDDFAAQNALDGPLQNCDAPRLVDVAGRADAHCLHDALSVAVGREDQHLRPRRDCTEVAERAQNITASCEMPVHEADVRLLRTESGESVLDGRRLGHRPALAAKYCRQRIEEDGVIVAYHHLGHMTITLGFDSADGPKQCRTG